MTDTNIVTHELMSFLASDSAEVICVSGKWGVGKTFLWSKVLDDAHAMGKIPLKRYSYVSLFGVNSLDGLKTAIAGNSVSLDRSSSNERRLIPIGVENSFRKLFRMTRDAGKEISSVGEAIAIVDHFLFSNVRSQIVCIDDLERRGSDLSVKDVLGLISFLKEQRECKIALILNHGGLGDDQSTFDEHSEKVIDQLLNYEPSSESAVRICLDEKDSTDSLIAEFCATLRISNIRVIKKIERNIKRLLADVSITHEDVLRQIVQSLTLFTWSNFDRQEAPPLSYIEADFGSVFSQIVRDENAEIPENEKRWNQVLQNLNFGHVDELDALLIEGVKNGYFDHRAVAAQIEKLSKDISLQKQHGVLKQAWSLYHGSFQNNPDDVVNTIDTTYRENLNAITPGNLNSAVRLFRELGYEGMADNLIATYLEQEDRPAEFWDLNNSNIFPGDVTDEAVSSAFRERHEALLPALDTVEVLKRLASSNGWSRRDIDHLSSVTTDEFFEIFKNHEGDDLHDVITGALNFRQISNADEKMVSITHNAVEALKRIGRECEINARRIQKLGISVAQAEEAR